MQAVIVSLHVCPIGFYRVQVGCLYPVQRVNEQPGLCDMNAFRMQLHILQKGGLRLAAYGILPFQVYQLQLLQVCHNGVAMDLRRCGIDVQEVLQYGRFRALHGILVSILLILRLRMLIEVIADKRDAKRNNQRHNQRCQPAMVAGLLFLAIQIVIVSISRLLLHLLLHRFC